MKLIPPDIFGARPDSGKVDWLYQAKWTEIPTLLHPQTSGARNLQAGSYSRTGAGSGPGSLTWFASAVIRAGSSFADDPVDHIGDRSWRDAADFPEAWKDSIVQAAVGSKRRIRGIVNFWSLDLPTVGMTVDQLELAQRVVLGSTLSLVQAIVEPRQALSATPRIWLVTRNVVSVSPDAICTLIPRAQQFGASGGAPLSSTPKYGAASWTWQRRRRPRKRPPGCSGRFFKAVARISSPCEMVAGLPPGWSARRCRQGRIRSSTRGGPI